MNAQRNDNSGPRRGKSAETGEDVTTLEKRSDEKPVTAPPPSEAEPAPPPPRRGFRPHLFPAAGRGSRGTALTIIGGSGRSCRSSKAHSRRQQRPPPKVTVAKPLIRELVEIEGLHRAVRGGRFRGRAGTRQRLSRIHQFHRRPERQEGRSALRHRAEAVRARARIGHPSCQANANLDLAKAQLARTAELRKRATPPRRPTTNASRR